MTHVTYEAAATVPTVAPAAMQKNLLVRIFDALVEARMRQAHREIVRHFHLVPAHVSAGIKNVGDERGAQPCA